MAYLLPNNALDAGMAYNKGINLGTRPATSGQSGPTPAVPDNVFTHRRETLCNRELMNFERAVLLK